jgi:hypothetical protein
MWQPLQEQLVPLVKSRVATLAGAVQLQRAQYAGRTWNGHQRRLQDRRGMHDVGNIQRKLKNHAAACRVTDDMCPGHADRAHESAECDGFALNVNGPINEPLAP